MHDPYHHLSSQKKADFLWQCLGHPTMAITTLMWSPVWDQRQHSKIMYQTGNPKKSPQKTSAPPPPPCM